MVYVILSTATTIFVSFLSSRYLHPILLDDKATRFMRYRAAPSVGVGIIAIDYIIRKWSLYKYIGKPESDEETINHFMILVWSIMAVATGVVIADIRRNME